jgi:hypothetical protein
MRDSRIPGSAGIAFCTGLLFCTSPYISEVIVWEASFHYLQGTLFILCILTLLQCFLHRPTATAAFGACLIFLASVFSLELFYLTPLLSGLLILFYRFSLNYDKSVTRLAARYFLLPQAGLLIAHLLLVRAVFGTSSARLGDALLQMPLSYYAIRPPDYFLHLFGGRFLPQGWRSGYHQFFCTYAGAASFYLLLGAVWGYIIVRCRKMPVRTQLTSLLFACLMAAMALVTPLWFPERLLILGDRYLYIMLPFFFAVVALLIGHIESLAARRALFILILGLQCAGTLRLSGLWQSSQALTDRLQRSFHAPAGKVVLLLNNPQSLRGAPMIGAGAGGELKLMHNLLYSQPPITGQVIDVLAQELASPDDSVGIRVSGNTVFVTLRRPAARWWYGPDYARSYSTPDYEVRLPANERGDGYILSLKGDPGRFCLMYQHKGSWKTVELQSL